MFTLGENMDNQQWNTMQLLRAMHKIANVNIRHFLEDDYIGIASAELRDHIKELAHDAIMLFEEDHPSSCECSICLRLDDDDTLDIEIVDGKRVVTYTPGEGISYE
jgi:hypothetical protein